MGDSRIDDMSLLGEEEGCASSTSSRAGASLSVEGSRNQQEGEEPHVSEGKEWELVPCCLRFWAHFILRHMWELVCLVLLVFDHLQYAKMDKEGLEDLIMCDDVRVNTLGAVPDCCVLHKLWHQVYRTLSCTAFRTFWPLVLEKTHVLQERASRFFIGHPPPCVYLSLHHSTMHMTKTSQAFPLCFCILL